MHLRPMLIIALPLVMCACSKKKEQEAKPERPAVAPLKAAPAMKPESSPAGKNAATPLPKKSDAKPTGDATSSKANTPPPMGAREPAKSAPPMASETKSGKKPTITSLPIKKATGTKAQAATKSAQVKEKGLELLSTGKGPRFHVKYAFEKPGTTYKVRMRMMMKMAMAMGGQKSPPQSIPATEMLLSFTNRSVQKNGTLSFEYVVTEATSREKPATVSEAQFAAIKKQLASLKGLKGSCDLSPRGIPSNYQLSIPAATPAQLKVQMRQVANQIEQMTMPLPSKKIGIGAKWRTVRTVYSQGVRIRTRTTYELTAKKGNILTVKMVASQSAPVQKITNAQIPGVEQTLTHLMGNASGTMSVNLARPVPESTASSSLEMKSKISKKGSDESMDLAISLTMKVVFSFI